MARTSNELWDIRNEVGEENRARFYIMKVFIDYVMGFGPYLNENEKSLANKWHDQTDTLKRPLWLSRGE